MTILATTSSLTLAYTAGGRSTEPGVLAFRCDPAGENGSTGATNALPSLRAMASAVRRAIKV